tara:strand:+ start:5044 stop:5973 length:930 start_codon:yes stop_codon:yes gene_type:complete
MDEKKEIVEVESSWSPGHEKILIDWADKAMCYRWLHARSHQKFSKVNTYFTIPVIIMSTLTGTANFAQDRVPEDYRGYYSMGVGFVNILAGIITTIQQFLKISELNEAHRVSSIHWDKFYRKIKIELAKPHCERQNVINFLKLCTEEFDRLMETSPIIEKSIILLFQTTFSNKKMTISQKEAFKKLKKPEICDSLESVELSIYVPDKTKSIKDEYKNLLNEVVVNISSAATDTSIAMKNDVISKFVNLFETEMLRKPTLDELESNLISDETKITKEDIHNYWNETISKPSADITNGNDTTDTNIEIATL